MLGTPIATAFVRASSSNRPASRTRPLATSARTSGMSACACPYSLPMATKLSLASVASTIAGSISPAHRCRSASSTSIIAMPQRSPRSSASLRTISAMARASSNRPCWKRTHDKSRAPNRHRPRRRALRMWTPRVETLVGPIGVAVDERNPREVLIDPCLAAAVAQLLEHGARHDELLLRGHELEAEHLGHAQQTAGLGLALPVADGLPLLDGAGERGGRFRQVPVALLDLAFEGVHAATAIGSSHFCAITRAVGRVGARGVEIAARSPPTPRTTKLGATSVGVAPGELQGPIGELTGDAAVVEGASRRAAPASAAAAARQGRRARPSPDRDRPRARPRSRGGGPWSRRVRDLARCPRRSPSPHQRGVARAMPS